MPISIDYLTHSLLAILLSIHLTDLITCFRICITVLEHKYKYFEITV